MEWNDVEVRQMGNGRVEAELRGDYLIDGNRGCWVSIVGRGPTEEDARASLNVAIADLQIQFE